MIIVETRTATAIAANPVRVEGIVVVVEVFSHVTISCVVVAAVHEHMLPKSFRSELGGLGSGVSFGVTGNPD